MKFAKFFLVICLATLALPFLALAGGTGYPQNIEVLSQTKSVLGTHLVAEVKNYQGIVTARLEAYDANRWGIIGLFKFENGVYKVNLFDIFANYKYRFIVIDEKVPAKISYKVLSCSASDPTKVIFTVWSTSSSPLNILSLDLSGHAFLLGKDSDYSNYVSIYTVINDSFDGPTQSRETSFQLLAKDFKQDGTYCFQPNFSDFNSNFYADDIGSKVCCPVKTSPNKVTPVVSVSCTSTASSIRADISISPFSLPAITDYTFQVYDGIDGKQLASPVVSKLENLPTNTPFVKKVAYNISDPNRMVCVESNIYDSQGNEFSVKNNSACCRTTPKIDLVCSGGSATALFGSLKGTLNSASILFGASAKIVVYESGKSYTSPDAKSSQPWTIGSNVLNQTESLGGLKSGTNYCFTALYNEKGTWKPVPNVSSPCCTTKSLLTDDVDFYKSKGRDCYYLKIINPGKTLQVVPEINEGKFYALDYGPRGYLNSVRNAKVKYAGSGTFFSWNNPMVQPEGMLMANGKLLRIYNENGSSFCQDKNGDFRMGKAQFNIEAEVQEIAGGANSYRFLEISQLNSLNTSPMVRMFTSEWNGGVPVSSGFVRYVAVDKNNVITGISSKALSIPAGGNLIVYNNLGLERFDCAKNPNGCLKVGYHLKFKWNALAGNAVDLVDWQANCVNLISGVPTLLTKGVITPNVVNAFRGGHTSERSAIGIVDKNNAVLMVCRGINAQQMAYAFLDVGVKDAVNLDGSGSAFLYYNPDGKPYDSSFLEGFYDGRTLGDILLIKQK